MGFWIFMLIMVLLIPLMMIGFGRLFLKKAPGTINAAFGYRTSMSMKNKDTWEFAHRYCGRLSVLCRLCGNRTGILEKNSYGKRRNTKDY